MAHASAQQSGQSRLIGDLLPSEVRALDAKDVDRVARLHHTP
jgi:hypothetical protein